MLPCSDMGSIMKYTLPFLLALDQPVLVSPITAKWKCVFHTKSMHAPSDISGCNHATGSIMKYTHPFLLALDQPVCLFTS